MQKWILGGAILLAVVAGAVIARVMMTSAHGNDVEVTWDQLGQLDYISGKAPDPLRALDGKDVRVPGFMVPLEDSQKDVTEFLLVPTPQACIHVPPPPPNQMVYVKMVTPTDVAYAPIWVHGRLKLTSKRHMYGESSFEMEGVSIEVYR